MKKIFQCAVYASVGALVGLVVLRSMMAAVWGAPVSPLQFVALASSIGLLVAAGVSLVAGRAGRIVGTASVLGLGVAMVPSFVGLVPEHGVVMSAWGYVFVAGYLLLLAFALFYPQRFRLSVSLLALAVASAAGFAGYAYHARSASGEYAWPAIECFTLTPGSDLVAGRDPWKWVNEELCATLRSAGIAGVLRSEGGTADSGARTTLIVICAARPPAAKQLFFPRHGTLVYLFDGNRWRTFPSDAEVYPRFVSLQPDGMLREASVSGGAREYRVYAWR